MGIFRTLWSVVCAAHRLVCLVHGHELVMQFDHRRLSLRCVHCGYRTPGWALGEPPRITASVVRRPPFERVAAPGEPKAA